MLLHAETFLPTNPVTLDNATEPRMLLSIMSAYNFQIYAYHFGLVTFWRNPFDKKSNVKNKNIVQYNFRYLIDSDIKQCCSVL